VVLGYVLDRLEPRDCSLGPCWKATSGRAAPGFCHEPLDLQSYVFEDLFDGPAFFSELDLVFGQSYHYVNLEMLPLLPFREGPDRSSGLPELRVDMAERFN